MGDRTWVSLCIYGDASIEVIEAMIEAEIDEIGSPAEDYVIDGYRFLTFEEVDDIDGLLAVLRIHDLPYVQLWEAGTKVWWPGSEDGELSFPTLEGRVCVLVEDNPTLEEDLASAVRAVEMIKTFPPYRGLMAGPPPEAKAEAVIDDMVNTLAIDVEFRRDLARRVVEGWSAKEVDRAWRAVGLDEREDGCPEVKETNDDR